MLQVPDIKVRISSNPALSKCSILLATSEYVRIPERVRIRLKVFGIVLYQFQVHVSQVKVSGLVRTKNDIVVEQVGMTSLEWVMTSCIF